MKKAFTLVIATALLTQFSVAQCSVNPSAQTVPGVNPPANQLPCIIQNEPYDQTLQGKIQTDDDVQIFIISAHLVVDSVTVDSIGGLPSGIQWTKNPSLLLGGENGCIQLIGTTNAPTGRYNLTAYGVAWLTVQATVPLLGNINTPRAFTGSLNNFSPFGGYYLDVIAPGTLCDHSALGVNDFNSVLNSSLSVYPNPSNGKFEIALNAGNRVNGNMRIVDMSGRVVYSEPLDVLGLFSTTVDITSFAKGLYQLQLQTADGFASKNISIE